MSCPWSPGKVKVVSDALPPPGLYSPWSSPGQNTGVGSLSLLQGIFPTQGSHPGLPHCRQILYQLNHKGRPRILEWVVYPFSSGSSWPRNRTWVSWNCRWILYQLSYQESPGPQGSLQKLEVPAAYVARGIPPSTQAISVGGPSPKQHCCLSSLALSGLIHLLLYFLFPPCLLGVSSAFPSASSSFSPSFTATYAQEVFRIISGLNVLLDPSAWIPLGNLKLLSPDSITRLSPPQPYPL